MDTIIQVLMLWLERVLLRACMRFCVRAFLHVRVRFCVSACVSACVSPCVCFCVSVCVRSCVPAFLRACVHAFLRSCARTRAFLHAPLRFCVSAIRHFCNHHNLPCLTDPPAADKLCFLLRSWWWRWFSCHVPTSRSSRNKSAKVPPLFLIYLLKQ